MIIMPSIDLLNSKAVRLKQGDFKRVCEKRLPLEQVNSYAQAGAKWVHCVDLQRAKGGKNHLEFLKSIPSELNVQWGGGVKSLGDIEELIHFGAKRVVVGSLCVENPSLVKEALETWPSQLVLAFDVRYEKNGYFAYTQAWQKRGNSLDDLLDRYNSFGKQVVLSTDISRDGMMKGPSLALYRHLKTRFPQHEYIASGGIKEANDLHMLDDQGVMGAILGRSLYQNTINLKEVIQCWPKG